jgi:hypothetical protein
LRKNSLGDFIIIIKKPRGKTKMKKKALTAALAAAFVLTTAGSVFANGVEFDGSVNFQFRQNTADGAADESGNRLQFILNGTAPEFGKNIDLYFRIAGERTSGINGWRDFEVADPDSTDTTVFGLDQFGFNYKNAGWNYKIGRQSSFIGGTGIIYDDTGAMGRHIFGDGITITGQTGAVDVKLSAVRFDFYDDLQPKLYSVAGTYKASKNLAVGGTFARVSLEGENANAWAVNAAYDVNSKVNLFGEYGKSNADENNKAYAFGGSYSIDKKNSVYAIYSHVESDFTFESPTTGAQSTTYDLGKEGMYYGFGHQFDKTTSLSLFYKDMENIETGKGVTSFRTTVNYKF